MKKFGFLIIPLISLLLLGACSEKEKEKNYIEKEVQIYRKASEADKNFTLRFYNDQPNVPYVEVNKYFQEFFHTALTSRAENGVYKYYNSANKYIGFDVENGVFSSNDLKSFNNHPDFKISSGKNFIKGVSTKQTAKQERHVSLKNYHIPLYAETNSAYVPFTFLSKFMGGSVMYNIAYNGRDIYVIDRGGQLGDPVDYSTFGDAYYSLLNDVNTPRPADLAAYSYNELCFVWDNMRGLTSQLVMGDNNLLSIGLNATIEKNAPKLKEYLLSTNKQEYYQGYFTLFNALYDGGHTGGLANFGAYSMDLRNQAKLVEEFQSYNDASALAQATRTVNLLAYTQQKTMHFDYAYNTGPHNYYSYDSSSKTSYIGFDSFEFDFNGWDDYYNGKAGIPVETDSYAYVRNKLYQAKSDGAENIVLDLTTNGGGAVAALIGLVGLFNEGKSYYNMGEIFNHSVDTDEYVIDVNLDGKFDDADNEELKQFNFNVGVLTSECAFSCGNLFPSVMKELGYKILGAKSGGGSCAISYESTADGMPYVRSSMSFLSNNKGDNIDDGVKVDLEIEKLPHATLPNPMFNSSNFYDASITGGYLSTAYSA